MADDLAIKYAPQFLVQRLADALLTYPQTEYALNHYFSHGVYARELILPKNTVLTGRVHKYANMNVLMSGDMTVTTDTGMERIQGPRLIVSAAGTMRAAFCHEDCVWITFLGTDCQDPDQIEHDFSFGTFDEYLAWQREVH